MKTNVFNLPVAGFFFLFKGVPMTLSKEEMHNEFAYNMTMAHVKNLLKMGLITTDEYWQINQKYKKKYRPVSDGLMSECELLCMENRA